MERFRSESRTIVRQFLDREIARRECETALGQTLLEAIPRLGPGQTEVLFVVIRANTEAVLDRVERRGRL